MAMSLAFFPGLQREHTPQFSEKELSWFQSDTQDSSNKPEGLCACAGCGEEVEKTDADEIVVCRNCGEVVERTLDPSAEYRFFGAEDRSSVDPCRVGAPIDMRFPASTLGTIILHHSSGGPASAGRAMARIRRYHTWNMIPYKERSLLQVFEQYALTATNFGINMRAIDTAKQLYIQLVEHCDRRGMSRNCVVASSLYAALKMVGEPRKPKEIADMFHLTTAQFTKSYKYFQEVLALARQRGQIADTLAPANQASTRASDYITHPLSKLPVARSQYSDIQFKAMEIANKAEDLLVSPENMPPSLAAGVLAFVLARMKYADIPIARIASVCNISEGTLTKCLKRLEASSEKLWSE
jgi:transcription initiation factor TFIIIB Brf1 subunit/transcription initiation factor TFIIB